MKQKNNKSLISRILHKNGDLSQSLSELDEILDNTNKTPEEVADNTKKELDKYGLKPTEKVTVTDPLTGASREITLSREGYGENSLIVALADPNMSRDKKDFMLSMYLYERGKSSASMLVDLMRYKGEHTKETRVFKSQMRFDFELFVSQFSKFIREQSRLIGIALDGMDIDRERTKFMDWLKEQKERDKEREIEKDYTYVDYFKTKPIEEGLTINRSEVALIQYAIQSLDEGERLIAQIQNVAKAREREKGKGIYIDSLGRPYMYDDPEITDAIKADKERSQKLDEELKNE